MHQLTSPAWPRAGRATLSESPNAAVPWAGLGDEFLFQPPRAGLRLP